MTNRVAGKIKLQSVDQLLGVPEISGTQEIEIVRIHAFPNHPFKVLDDEKMQDLIESVKLSGVLTPVLLRVDSNDEYEMISGHRRLHAAKMAGLTTIPAIVRKLSDDAFSLGNNSSLWTLTSKGRSYCRVRRHLPIR